MLMNDLLSESWMIQDPKFTITLTGATNLTPAILSTARIQKHKTATISTIYEKNSELCFSLFIRNSRIDLYFSNQVTQLFPVVFWNPIIGHHSFKFRVRMVRYS